MSSAENTMVRPIFLPIPCSFASLRRVAWEMGNVPSATSCLAVLNFGPLTMTLSPIYRAFGDEAHWATGYACYVKWWIVTHRTFSLRFLPPEFQRIDGLPR